MEFYVYINDSQQGPYTIDQLAELNITPETEVWAEGMDDWKQAGDVPALTTLLQQMEYRRRTAAAARQAVPPMPQCEPVRPAAEPVYERSYTAPAQPAKSEKRGGGCLLWGSLVVFIMLVVLVVTVPSREDHLNKIKDVTREWMSATVSETGIGGGILGEVAKWIGGAGTDMVIDQMFSYDNYFVCSMGTFNYGTHSKHVSLGLLGHVFTFGTDDINEALREALPGHEPTEDVAPEVEEQEPQESYEEPEAPAQDDEEVAPSEGGNSNAAQELLDSIAARAKREAVKAAKEWAKKKIDEM